MEKWMTTFRKESRGTGHEWMNWLNSSTGFWVNFSLGLRQQKLISQAELVEMWWRRFVGMQPPSYKAQPKQKETHTHSKKIENKEIERSCVCVCVFFFLFLFYFLYLWAFLLFFCFQFLSWEKAKKSSRTCKRRDLAVSIETIRASYMASAKHIHFYVVIQSGSILNSTWPAIVFRVFKLNILMGFDTRQLLVSLCVAPDGRLYPALLPPPLPPLVCQVGDSFAVRTCRLFALNASIVLKFHGLWIHPSGFYLA